jgi:hypothetical protein
VAAAQGDDRDLDRGGRLLEGGRGGRHGDAVPDADRRSAAQRAAQHVGCEPADHPTRQLLRSRDGRGEVDGIEPEPGSQGLGRGTLDRGPVDDPDLDDALGSRALEQARDLRPGDAELLGDPFCSPHS